MSPNPVADMTLVLGVEPSETLFLYVYDVQGKLVNKHAFVQSDINLSVITSYSIHYTKLYEATM